MDNWSWKRKISPLRILKASKIFEIVHARNGEKSFVKRCELSVEMVSLRHEDFGINLQCFHVIIKYILFHVPYFMTSNESQIIPVRIVKSTDA